MHFNIIKTCDKTTANIILNDEKLRKLSSKRRNKTLAAFIEHSVGSPHCSSQARKCNKRRIIGKEVKLSLFDIIRYVENPKDFTKKQLELVSSAKLQDMKSVCINLLCEMLDWMKHNLESRFQGEIPITSDMKMTSHFQQKAKKS